MTVRHDRTGYFALGWGKGGGGERNEVEAKEGRGGEGTGSKVDAFAFHRAFVTLALGMNLAKHL